MSQRMRREAATAGFLPLTRRESTRGGKLLVGEAPLLALRRRPMRLRWGRYLVAGTALYCAWLGHTEWQTYRKLTAQDMQLQAQASALRQQQAVLRGEIAYAQTDGYVEGQARQQLGLVGPGEVPLAPLPAAGASGSTGSPPS